MPSAKRLLIQPFIFLPLFLSINFRGQRRLLRCCPSANRILYQKTNRRWIGTRKLFPAGNNEALIGWQAGWPSRKLRRPFDVYTFISKQALWPHATTPSCMLKNVLICRTHYSHRYWMKWKSPAGKE